MKAPHHECREKCRKIFSIYGVLSAYCPDATRPLKAVRFFFHGQCDSPHSVAIKSTVKKMVSPLVLVLNGRLRHRE